MTELHLIPSIIASVFLLSIAIYLLFKKPRRDYIIPLIFFCFAAFIWNIGVMITNITNGEIIWAQISALGLIFIPPVIFHFAVEYTKFFEDKYYLLAYIPAFLLALSLPLGYYVTGVNKELAYGMEPTYEFLLFSLNSWIGFFLVLFSIFMLFKYYRESVGIKKRQALIILFAIPTNAFLSFISYVIMVEIFHVAQFPVGALLDLLMVSLIVYAILRLKLPVETAVEIDFRILAETASEGICIIDREGDIEYSNKHFCEMVNTPKKEVLGNAFKHFVSSTFHEKFNDIIKKTLEGEKIFGMEIALKKEGDGTISAEMNTSPIIWNDRIIGSFITIRDIEERKRAEEALKESEEKYRTLVENLNVGVYRNTPGEKGRFIEANPAIIRMFGYESKEEFLKLNVSDLYYHPEERKKFNEKMLREGFVKNEEIQLRRKDGTPIWGSVTAKAVRDEHGEVRYYDGIIEDITDRKKTEEALRESEEKYRTLAEQSMDGIFLALGYKLMYANSALLNILGAKSFDELKDKNLLRFLQEEDAEKIRKDVERGLKGEISEMRYELKAKRLDEKEIFIDLSITRVMYEGKPHALGIVRDITEKKKMEEALKESEERYRSIVENSHAGILIVDDNFCIIYANDQLANIVGYKKDEIIGKDFRDFLDEESKELVAERYKKRQRGEDVPHRYECRVVRKDGEKRDVELSAVVIKDREGKMRTIGQILDITDRKKAEEELRKQKTYFQALFESSPEAIVSLDEKHRVLDLNPAFIELFGYTIEDLKGKDLDDFVLPEDEEEKGRELTEKVIHGEIVRSEGLRKRKNGSLIPVSILGAPIFIEGKQVGIFTIYRDITARKEAEQEREFYDSLLRHDVANRNTIIQGSLELLAEENLTGEQQSIVQNALKAARSSSELIEMIRDLRRISGEQSFIPINLHEILSKVVSIFEQQAKNKGIEIIYTPIQGTVKADSLLENAFSNIIQNAIIHSNCSKINISGGEEEKRGKAVYRISIEDDGEGIPDDIYKNIFSPGVKSKSSAGSGLGLYLVKKIIESYGGYIAIRKPEKGKGTIFDIYIPKFK
ncbi:MAG: PAS domain S-box protein [Thermoplasmata archaeon]|nr:MAG: PAS domain S-box protein [Thermoplasmata archaeon]